MKSDADLLKAIADCIDALGDIPSDIVTEKQLQAYRLVANDENASASSVPVNTINQAIGLAERRIYREVRSRHNEKALALTVASNAVTIPADFEALSIAYFSGYQALEPVTEEWLLQYLEGNPTGPSRYIAAAGTSFKFGSPATDGASLIGRYFYRFDPLTSSTFGSNTLLSKEEDLFIYATLVEAAPLFAATQQAPLWDAKYTAIKDRINTERSRAALNAGRPRIRASTTLMG